MRLSRRATSHRDYTAAYHCMSRCIQGRDLLDDTAREVFKNMIWKVAEFCGVDVVTYAVMPNHFHVLIRVPVQTPLDDKELLRRYRLLHPSTTTYETTRYKVIADRLRRNTPEAQAWRSRQLALMNDLSSFMRLLKQRFSIWYNKTHNDFGTLWAERFKSVLVEYRHDTLRTMAAYIDLNAVRKGLVDDPKDYRWCGYAEALAGSKRARRGLGYVCPHISWSKALADYRTILYTVGAAPREKGRSLSDSTFRAVMAADGHLSMPELLRHRWRYFTDATVLGSESFVARQRDQLQPGQPRDRSRNRPPATPWGNWFMLHRLNRHARD